MTFLVIKVTNSVTLKVLNTARNGAFVLFTVNSLHEEASNSQIFGYSVSIAAFCSYSFFRITGGLNQFTVAIGIGILILIYMRICYLN